MCPVIFKCASGKDANFSAAKFKTSLLASGIALEDVAKLMICIFRACTTSEADASCASRFCIASLAVSMLLATASVVFSLGSASTTK